MIFKKDLLEGLDELTMLVMRQGEDIRLLQHRVDELESKPEKRGRGRPRKNQESSLERAIKSVSKPKANKTKNQPRDKSGKFVKK